jgi:hypothetical protein
MMEIDEETLRLIELQREWKAGYDTGREEEERKHNLIVEELLLKIKDLERKMILVHEEEEK